LRQKKVVELQGKSKASIDVAGKWLRIPLNADFMFDFMRLDKRSADYTRRLNLLQRNQCDKYW
jgi:hypothetical protein